jgi:hypothetical protein
MAQDLIPRSSENIMQLNPPALGNHPLVQIVHLSMQLCGQQSKY